jgi:hypothetical protein
VRKVKQRMVRDGILRVEDLDCDGAVPQIEHWLTNTDQTNTHAVNLNHRLPRSS